MRNNKYILIIFLSIFILFVIFTPNKQLFSKPKQRVISSGRHEWIVESYMNKKVNPGPNFFSSEEKVVWIDTRDFINLNVVNNDNNQWVCSSVRSTEPAKYGIHRFKVIGNIERIDPNIVLGLFLYRIDPKNPKLRAEIDIEFSTWGLPDENKDKDAFTLNNTHYILWKPWNNETIPAIIEVNSFWLRMPRGTHTSHEIHWTQEYIRFLSYYGHASTNPKRVVINDYRIPITKINESYFPLEKDCMHLMMNLWLHSNHSQPYDNHHHNFKIYYEYEAID